MPHSILFTGRRA